MEETKFSNATEGNVEVIISVQQLEGQTAKTIEGEQKHRRQLSKWEGKFSFEKIPDKLEEYQSFYTTEVFCILWLTRI